MRAERRADVAIDVRQTSHMSAGMTLYVRKLLEWLPRVAPDLVIAPIGAGDNFDVAEQAGLPLAMLGQRPRLVHVPTPFVPVVVPAPLIVTIHDLIDLQFPHFGKRKVGPYYRWVVGPVTRRAQAVLTDDAATAADLESRLGVAPNRIRIIPLGVDDLPGRPQPQPGVRPYFLYVGNHRGHKNLETLVNAWAQLPAHAAADLRLTGPDDTGPAFAAARRRSAGRLIFAGDVPAAELVALYAGARAYVHPALREGFGLPMLEAMRAGIPVIAARSALPGVLAPYAWAFEPRDADALGELLGRVLAQPEPFAARARAAAAATAYLTWERVARATADVYREFLP